MKKMSTKNMVLAAILTALVIILQYISMMIRTGTFSITLSLVPIAIGAAVLGISGGAWLGLVFGVAVLATGDAAPFMALSIPGTIITVLAKGILSGVAAGVIFKVFKEKNLPLAVIISAISCPIVNTGIFIIGVLVFFLNHFMTDGMTIPALIFGFIGFNFLIELIVNIVLSPTIVRLINIRNK